jgi:hypothetical protein
VRRIAATVGGVALTAALAGCGGSAPVPGSVSPGPTSVAPSLSLRPAELRLDGVAPCTLLTAAQRGQLGVSAGQAANGSTSDATVHGAACMWLSLTQHPAEGYTATAVLNQGAESALTAEPLRWVDGFAATATTSTGSDPRHFCGLLVDVAPGQALAATYSDITEEQAGQTRQAACDKAQRLAEALVTTLRAKAGQ